MQLLGDWQWYDYGEIGSTNDAALALTSGLRSGQKIVVTAERQTSGRGRRGRSWIGCEGNLYMSLGIEAALIELDKIVFMTSLCLLLTINELRKNVKVEVKLKWPNDVLVNGGKVSGILLEKGQGDYLIVGIGVNIAAAPQVEGLIYPAVSLKEAGIETDRITFLKKYLAIWDKTRDTWGKEGFEPIREMWLENVKGLNEEIFVINENNEKKGLFLGVDENGALLLKTAEGVIKIRAGDVFYLRKDVG